MNKVILCGNLGADPELKYTQGNQAVLSLRLATTEKWVDKAGAKQERTEWHSLTVWGRRAEALSKILHKGERVLVEGQIQYQQWEKDGQKRTSTSIKVDELELLGSGKRDGNGGEQSIRGNGNVQVGGDFNAGGGGGEFGDDDIPFAPRDERIL